MKLPKPFDTFRVEKMPGDYKDFQIAPDDPYPLKGVTFPTIYGDIQGYKGEDGHPLDVFIGTGNLNGVFTVFRPDVKGGEEHKFCLNLTEKEEADVHRAFAPVLQKHSRFDTFEDLVKSLEPFKVGQ